MKALLQHFGDHVVDSTMASNESFKKYLLFIRDGKELFAAVVEKSKNSSSAAVEKSKNPSFITDNDGGIWQTKHIHRIDCRPGKTIIKNADFIAEIGNPSGVSPSAPKTNISLKDDLRSSTSPSPAANSEECAAVIVTQKDVHHMKTFAKEEQMLGEKDVSSSKQAISSPTEPGKMISKNADCIVKSEDPSGVSPSATEKTISLKDDLRSTTSPSPADNSEECVAVIVKQKDVHHMKTVAKEKQMLGEKDVSSSKQAISSPTEARKLIIRTANLIVTIEHVKDDITFSVVRSPPTVKSENCVATGLSQKDEEVHLVKTVAEEEEMLGRKDISRSVQANPALIKIWELRFECDMCKEKNEIVFLKPFKIGTEFTIFLCPSEECIYPLWVKHLYRFMFRNLPDEMLLPCTPDNVPTVYDIISIIRQSSPQNASSAKSLQ